MIVSIIAAVSENNVIGNKGTLPWHLPDDMRRFRKLTEGCPIIMGRKTHESIGKPLAHRTNLIITRKKKKIVGCRVVHSLKEALKVSKAIGAKEAFIIGGGKIYAQALPLADRFYLTRVHAKVDGDTFFPRWNEEEWKEISKEQSAADPEHPYPCTFLVYTRKEVKEEED